MRFLSVLCCRFALCPSDGAPRSGVSAVAILCLALGIGASSAMSSLVYALWAILTRTAIQPPGESQLRQPAGARWNYGYSLADYLELQSSTTTLEEIAARDGMNAMTTSGLPESVRVVLFTPNAFDHFGVPAMIGRTWSPKGHSQPGAPPPVAVLSYLFWTRHFNGDRAIRRPDD